MARFGLRRVGARSAPERRRHRSCGCAAYAPFELQDRDDGDAGGKTSEVGEVRDVRGLVADDAEDVERRDQLQQQPFAEDEDGGQGHRSDEQTHGDQYAHSPGRYQGQVRAKDPGDRSGRTDQMRRTEDRLLDESLGDRRDTTGKEIEDQERDAPDPHLDRRTEHPEEEHVAGDVEPSGVQELVRDEGKERVGRDLAAREHPELNGWIERPTLVKSLDRGALVDERKHVYPCGEIDEDQKRGDDRDAGALIKVAERDHRRLVTRMPRATRPTSW